LPDNGIHADVSPQIRTILFDCDNTLVLSEDIAFIGCSQLGNEALRNHGIAKQYTGPEMMHEFVGLSFRNQLAALQQRHGFSMTDSEVDAFVARELGTIIENLEKGAEPCEGSVSVLERLHDGDLRGKYDTAIVSSSAISRVEASIRKTGQDRFFPHHKVFSAASSMPQPSSKPDPAIYLWACEKLGVDPKQAVAVEDSKSGATAAKRAGIPLMGYVGPYYAEGGKEKADEMDKMLRGECGAIAVMHNWSEFEKCLKDVEAAPLPK
jgi:beta-phosphoglucomutase-like phosphatase (HAD superfamily)